MTQSVFSDRYRRLRELLIEARKKSRLTQVQLAQKLSRPQSFVSKYELGERRLDVVEFLEVTKALGAKPDRILNRIALGAGKGSAEA